MSSALNAPINDTRELVLQVPVRQGSRGRNGIFTASRVQLWTHRAGGAEPSYVSLVAWSLRKAENAPAQITLSLEDAVVLAEQLRDAVAHVFQVPSHPEADTLRRIVDVLKDERGEWRQLQSCADAVQEISRILEEPGNVPPTS